MGPGWAQKKERFRWDCPSGGSLRILLQFDDEPLCIQSTKQIVYYPAPKIGR
jgi:hypothetical protein